MSSMASSRVSTLNTQSTGPKISSLYAWQYCTDEEVDDANDVIRWRIVKISRYNCYFENWWRKPNRHVGFHFSDYWRSTEVAIWVAFHLVGMKENSTRCLKCEMNSNRCSPSVQQQLCSLIHSWLKATRSTKQFWICWQSQDFFNYLKIPTWINLSILAFEAGEITGGMSVLASWPGPTCHPNLIGIQWGCQTCS